MLYGVDPDSDYVKVDTKDGVYISSAYADKFQIKKGDMIKLKEKYEKDTYSFKVKGIYQYSGALCVFMDQQKLNKTFDLGTDYYSGYFSKTKITDIDEKYIGSVIDLSALTKVSRQLDVSMGNMMGLVNGFAVAIFLVLIYLLSKIIIEKNAQSISMAKILGYTDGEIGRLYILSYIDRCNTLPFVQFSDRRNIYENNLPGDDASQHFRLDHTVDRSEDLCRNVRNRVQ